MRYRQCGILINHSKINKTYRPGGYNLLRLKLNFAIAVNLAIRNPRKFNRIRSMKTITRVIKKDRITIWMIKKGEGNWDWLILILIS